MTVGTTYEYQIVKASTVGYTGYGYIYAGINAPLVDSRGKVILVVDNSFSSSLSNELARLQSDLTGDGWSVVRRDVGRNDTPQNVKSVITAAYQADTNNVKAVFLFGHVPILAQRQLERGWASSPPHAGRRLLWRYGRRLEQPKQFALGC